MYAEDGAGKIEIYHVLPSPRCFVDFGMARRSRYGGDFVEKGATLLLVGFLLS